ncbi:MAG: phage tail tape measure protein [Alistipes sp.]
MSDYAFNYSFNITGDASSVAQQLTGDVTALSNTVQKATGVWDSFSGKIVAFNQLSQFVEGFSQTVENTLAPGAALNSSIADLSAISGEAGDGLKTIEKYAREAATTFGGSASKSVESYKLLLSQLTPELAKTPPALKAMGDNVSILSKTMGGNTTAAAEVLTTAMNQYGVSLADPMEASRKMAEMMNVMAAAGKEGSAELPTIKMALEQCGMAAKGAGVSFEETNAAIQVLDKAGKKGAEGGVALRNVMSILATGRFLPKDVREELAAAGVDINLLTDKSKSLTERLNPLQAVMQDSALFTKLFGRENSNAAMALVQGISEVDRYTEAISGTNTAFEQAEIIMDSYNERKSRVQAGFEDFKISVFNLTGNFGIWVETVADSLVPLAQLTPLLMLVGKGMMFIRNINFAGVFSSISRACTVARYQMLFMNAELRTGQMASIGFMGNIIRATLAVVRFGTVGIWNGIKALGAFALSLVTGGAASATFAGIASGAFATFKLAAVTACRAVGIAIMNIPIIGWIAAVLAGAIALGVYFWNTSTTVRAALKGLGAAFVAVFKGIWDLAKNVFSSIGDLIVAAFSLDGKGIKDAINKLKGGFSEFGTNVGKAFNDAYNGEMAKSKSEVAAKKKKEENPDAPVIVATDAGGGSISTGLSGIGGSADKADKIKNINITIEKLIDKFEIHTTNLHEDVSKVKDMVAEALTGAVNDVNYAM